MNVQEAMASLAAAGTAQNIKIYKRHGAMEPLFGVSFAHLKQMKKQIKTDHPLALALWATGNTDARTLALMVIDGPQVSGDQVNQMLSEIRYYALVDMLVAEVVLHQKDARARMTRWTRAKKELYQRAGYSLLTQFARMETSLPDKIFRQYIARIEAEIHHAPNRAKQMMNIALLNIGLRPEPLHSEALVAAQRVGPVEVDHGETSCKTYDTAAMLADETYVSKARASKTGRHTPRRRKA